MSFFSKLAPSMLACLAALCPNGRNDDEIGDVSQSGENERGEREKFLLLSPKVFSLCRLADPHACTALQGSYGLNRSCVMSILKCSASAVGATGEEYPNRSRNSPAALYQFYTTGEREKVCKFC